MNQKLEEKILEELRARVIDKDRELQDKKEYREMRQATISALAEMTQLPDSEIDAMANEIHNEVMEKEKKRHIKIFAAVAVAAFIGLVVLLSVENSIPAFVEMLLFGGLLGGFYAYYRRHFRPRQLIIDNFDNTKLKWETGNYYKQWRYIEDQKYRFETNREDWCYWDKIPLHLPKKCTITARTHWQGGSYSGEYGIILLDINKNYVVFSANGKGSASYAIRKDKKYVVDKPWKNGKAKRGRLFNNFEVKLEDKKFEFRVNDNFVYSGDTERLEDFVHIGLRVCDKQKVDFYELKVKDDQSGEMVLSEDFTSPHQEWSARQEYRWKKEIVPEGYQLLTNADDYCYWTSAALNFGGDCDVTLSSRWLEGESTNYGLMLFDKKDCYFSFELQQNGKARYTRKTGEKYATIGDYQQTPYSSDGTNTLYQTVKIRKRKFFYYVNDHLVKSGEFPSHKVERVAVRVCGFQKVVFQKLVVEEKA